jgi:hypothetical protein
MEDWEHDCRAGILGVQPVYCPEALATVRDHGDYRASGMGEGFTADITRAYFAAHRSVYQRLVQAGLTTGAETSVAFRSAKQRRFGGAKQRRFGGAKGGTPTDIDAPVLTGREYLHPFSRKLFWIARMCAARGLEAEAREALALAMEAARPHGSTLEMRGFRVVAALIGWRAASRLSEGVRNLVRGGR